MGSQPWALARAAQDAQRTTSAIEAIDAIDAIVECRDIETLLVADFR
jgi:hypothetical protein